MIETRFTLSALPDLNTPDQVQTLLSEVIQTWWESEKSLPAFTRSHTPAEQARNEKDLSRLIDGLLYEIKRMGKTQAAVEAFQEKLRMHATAFACSALDLEERQIAFLEQSGLIDATLAFAKMARSFDPDISGDDIFQASRNVMSMNFVQLLLDLPVEVTPSVFAYSMLYPYTDNYLDDLHISNETKRSFNLRFQRRLLGEAITPTNAYEERIDSLVNMIEGQFERAHYPQVYESLLAIHAAQARSLTLVAPGASPFEADVLGISFEKGGTSVLADGYLVAGYLSADEARFLFGYGAFTQLMDDLEDIDGDMREGRMTIFTQTAPHWPLDCLTNRMFHFGRKLFSRVSVFHSPSAAPLADLIASSLDPMLVDTLGRASKYYSRSYLKDMQCHLPFRFGALQKQRARLDRNKVTLSRLINLWV